MRIGNLEILPVSEHMDLIAKPVAAVISALPSMSDISVAEIDPQLADTAAFCEHYGVPLGESVNCVVVEATRADETWYAACLVLATTRADINGLVRRTGWPVLIDAAVADAERVVIGSGIRGSKLIVSGKALATLPGAIVLENMGKVPQK